MTVDQFAEWLRENIAELQTWPADDHGEATYQVTRMAARVAEQRARRVGGQLLVPQLRAAWGLAETLDAFGECLTWCHRQSPAAAPSEPTVESPYYTADEAAAYLGMTVKQLYKAVEHRRINPLRGPRNSYRFDQHQLDAYLQRN